MYGNTNKRIWRHGITLSITVTLMAVLVTGAQSNPVEGWAVLMEINDFPEGYGDLPVNFIDIERMVNMLAQYGWQENHMMIRKDEITPETVKEGLDFLEKNADSNDIVLFYIGAHGGYIRLVLKWNEIFPPLWDEISTEKKLLLVDSCYAASFLPESKNFIGIASVSPDESGWAGLPEEGLPLIGFVFTYYFCESMKGDISVEEGFAEAVPQVRAYMKDVVYPQFKDVYPPEQYLNLYDPNPVIIDNYPGYLYLTLDNSAPVSGGLVLVGMLLLIMRKLTKNEYSQ
ncbi:MAG: caspase family protein [Theionarchaea archaeon]|nr:caspase family protein [Theionarchaea archaeon]